MADRVYPAATRPPAATNGGGANGGGNPAFPPNKAQFYSPNNRPLYRPPLKRRREHSRSCCCSCCLWTTLFIIILILLIAIAGAVFWVIYRPHRPSFSVSALQLSQFNLTSTGVASAFNFSVVARNPNKKIVFLYDPVGISILSDGVDIGDGSLPGFEQGTGNSTALKAVISSSGQSLDSSQISTLNSDLRNQKSLPIEIRLDTKMRAKIGKLKTKKVGIRVTCDGIKVSVPAGKTPATAATGNAKCTVDVRFKIWKWTV